MLKKYILSNARKFSTTTLRFTDKYECSQESWVRDYHHITGYPEKLVGRAVIIHPTQELKNPNQSTQLAKSEIGWEIKFVPKKGGMYREHLMGYTGSTDPLYDTMNYYFPKFKSKEDAKRYCTMHGFVFEVHGETQTQVFEKNYARQFQWSQPKEDEEW